MRWASPGFRRAAVAASMRASSACIAGQPFSRASASIAARSAASACGSVGQALAQRLEVKHGAACKQRHAAARGDLPHQPGRIGAKLRRRIALVGIDDIDQMMRHRGALCGAWLGRAHVHAAVHLRRVHADDLDRIACGDLERERGLAAGGGPHQQDGRGQTAGRSARHACEQRFSGNPPRSPGRAAPRRPANGSTPRRAGARRRRRRARAAACRRQYDRLRRARRLRCRAASMR